MDLEVQVNNFVDIIWAAGFIDGEGCIKISRQKVSYGFKYRHIMQLHVTQKVKFPLKTLSKLFGGKIYKSTDNRHVGHSRYEWCISGPAAFKALRILQPYLKLKQDECDIALYAEKYFVANLNKDIFKSRQRMYSKLRQRKDFKYERKTSNKTSQKTRGT